MGFIKRWVRNWLTDDGDSHGQELVVADSRGRDIESENSIRFEVIPARGGLVISVRHYDSKKDEHHWVNHVIHDDQDAPAAIAEIVSMSLLRM